MAHVWDPSSQVWRDTDYPDIWMRPSQYGGDDLWHNPQGGTSNGGPWSYVATGSSNPLQQAVNQNVAGTPAAQANGAFQPVSQLTANVQTQAFTQANNQQNNDATMQRQQALNQSNQLIAQLNAEKDKEVAKGNNASAERIAQLTYQINLENNKINMMNAVTNQEAEQRQERQLQANLAANPNDFVAYEYYKRALGSPTALDVVNNNGGVQAPSTPGTPAGQSPNTPDPSASGPVGTGVNVGRDAYYAAGGDGGAGNNAVAPTVATPMVAPTSSSQFSGTNYSPAPPAYDNNTLAGVANSIQNPSTQQWNPNLSGVGAFGSTINAPNQLGRSSYGNLSDSERAILTSFLNAGINMGGKQVSIDPSDYFSQMQKSWVPTLAGGTGVNTQYQG